MWDQEITNSFDLYCKDINILINKHDNNEKIYNEEYVSILERVEEFKKFNISSIKKEDRKDVSIYIEYLISHTEETLFENKQYIRYKKLIKINDTQNTN